MFGRFSFFFCTGVQFTILLLTLLLELSDCEDHVHCAPLPYRSHTVSRVVNSVPGVQSGDSATLVQGSCLRLKAVIFLYGYRRLVDSFHLIEVYAISRTRISVPEEWILDSRRSLSTRTAPPAYRLPLGSCQILGPCHWTAG